MNLNFKDIKRIYTHTGTFTIDDVVSISLIKTINPEVEVIRQDYINEDADSISIGIKDGTIVWKKDKYIKDICGNPYCLSSYVYEQIWEDLFAVQGIKNIDDAFYYFYDEVIGKITAIVNYGFKNPRYLPENSMIKDMNVTWFETANKTRSSDEQFYMALEFTTILIENWLRITKEEVDYRSIENDIWNKAKNNSENGIYVLDESIPWRYQIKNNPDTDAKIIISKSKRGGYNVTSKSTDELLIDDNEHLSFVHPSKFMGVAETLENAMLAAKCIINNSLLSA